MRRRWAAIGIASGALVGACVDLQPYACSDDAQCKLTGSEGWCEDAGYCSYPDSDCDSGRRYGDLAAGLSGQCTDQAGTAGSSDSTAPTTSDGSSTTAGQASSSSGSDDTSEDTVTPQPVCGDGVVEGDEECDDLDAVDGDGCNTDCVRGGSPRWSAVVASEGGGSDRLFGLTQLAAGDVVAVGQIQAATADVLLVRFTVDGREVQRVVHDVDGGFDDAEAVVQGGLGDLYVCGRATVGGSTGPWVGSWDAQLEGSPVVGGALPMTLDGNCHDITYATSAEVVAVGGTGLTAWSYTFPDDDVAGGEETVIATPGADRLKEVVRGPDTSIYVAGQLDDFGVVHQPVSPLDLGLPLVLTTEVVELQSMVVTDDTIFVGGLLREVASIDDLWLAAYELDGTERWRYAPDVPGIDEVEDIAVDAAGNVYAIGHRVSDDPDRWVGKLDPAGELVWQRSDYPGSEGDDRGRSIEVLPGGDLVVVAEVIDAGGELDGWIARLAP
jgi:cysteine-rich repeat protein